MAILTTNGTQIGYRASNASEAAQVEKFRLVRFQYENGTVVFAIVKSGTSLSTTVTYVNDSSTRVTGSQYYELQTYVYGEWVCDRSTASFVYNTGAAPAVKVTSFTCELLDGLERLLNLTINITSNPSAGYYHITQRCYSDWVTTDYPFIDIATASVSGFNTGSQSADAYDDSTDYALDTIYDFWYENGDGARFMLTSSNTTQMIALYSPATCAGEYNGGVIVEGWVSDTDFKGYSTCFNVAFTETRVIKRGKVETIGSQYPFVISHAAPNYHQGKLTALFMMPESAARGYGYHYGAERNANAQYRDELVDFLTDGNPKIIRYRDGRRRLVLISEDSIEYSPGETDDMTEISFSWVEIGNINSEEDLREAGFGGGTFVE